jgi:DNA-nicking Smr family endonuclease
MVRQFAAVWRRRHAGLDPSALGQVIGHAAGPLSRAEMGSARLGSALLPPGATIFPMRKKRRPDPPREAPPPPLNRPFADLKARWSASDVKPPSAKPAPPPPPPRPVSPPPGPSEAQLFADEMAGVEPLAPDPRGRLGAPPPSARPSGGRRVAEEAEAYAQLADLVDGVGPFDIADTDEYMEGLAPGIDRRLLKKLRRGDYALQAHLDLHGLVTDEAHLAVERFLASARAAGQRCVLIVHGRGHNSKEGIPVLKERLKVWLTRGRLSRVVLAFATARPADGGAGALYVLLRR